MCFHDDVYDSRYISIHDYMDYEPTLMDCRECGDVTYDVDICAECWALERAMERQEITTKAERREAKRVKGRYGPVRHLEGDYRPVKMRKPKVRGK